MDDIYKDLKNLVEKTHTAIVLENKKILNNKKTKQNQINKKNIKIQQ